MYVVLRKGIKFTYIFVLPTLVTLNIFFSLHQIPISIQSVVTNVHSRTRFVCISLNHITRLVLNFNTTSFYIILCHLSNFFILLIFHTDHHFYFLYLIINSNFYQASFLAAILCLFERDVLAIFWQLLLWFYFLTMLLLKMIEKAMMKEKIAQNICLV